MYQICHAKQSDLQNGFDWVQLLICVKTPCDKSSQLLLAAIQP